MRPQVEGSGMSVIEKYGLDGTSTPFAPFWITPSRHTHVEVVMCDSLEGLHYFRAKSLKLRHRHPLPPASQSPYASEWASRSPHYGLPRIGFSFSLWTPSHDLHLWCSLPLFWSSKSALLSTRESQGLVPSGHILEGACLCTLRGHSEIFLINEHVLW